ncbi:MAG: ABC transporter substrate-binding protein [Treponema sp.]|nr:ABC transporter substrate-binding protein [Treponema sp.]
MDKIRAERLCIIIPGFLLGVLLMFFSGCTPRPPEQEFITLGALLPLTGDSSDEGLRALNGLHQAKEEINASGGIDGKMLDILVLNDRGDRVFILEQYEKLINQGVRAIIGSSYSGPTIALAEISEQHGIPIISPTASNPAVTLGRSNVFRAIFTDDYQAQVMAHFAFNKLKAQTAAVLSNLSIETYIHASLVFAETFSSLGGQIIAYETYNSEEDFHLILQHLKEHNLDIIFCPEDFYPASVLVNTAYDLGLSDTVLLGTDAWDGILTYVYNPRAMENVYYTAPFSYDDPDEKISDFVKNYYSLFGQMPLAGSATAYTSLYLLSSAIEKAGSTSWPEIIAAMKSQETDTILGTIQFDENNNPYINVYIIQIKEGQYSAYDRISLIGRS